MNINKVLLQLFNCVLSDHVKEDSIFMPEYGLVIDKSATYAKYIIQDYIESEYLSATDYNKTFHKSWDIIKNSSRQELFKHQILHYLSTYGTNHTSSFVYTPTEELNVPDFKITVKVIHGITKDEVIDRSLKMLQSGIALKSETIDLLILFQC